MIDLKKIATRDDLELKLLEGGLFGGDIRVVKIGKDDLLFNAKDCALILEYKKYQNAIKHHVLDGDKIKLKLSNFNCPKTGQIKIYKTGEIFITEQGLYQLINGSKMPKAKDFQRWVGEVLTTFRKTGKYDMNDFKNSKFKKTIKQIPGYKEDENFKHDCTVAVREIAKQQHELTGNIWNKITNLFFDHFKINLLREITKFVKKNKLDKRPNVREYLDLAGYHVETYVAFEILRHDERTKSNPEMLAYTIAMCHKKFSMLNATERAEIKDILIKMFDKGILQPAADYDAIKSYRESKVGMKYISFNE